METNFFILEDDLACRRILAQIIEDEGLGEVTGELEDGHGHVSGVIISHNPDILLIDLLMPGKDGVEIVRQLRSSGFRGKIVMISQVEKKEMVAQAYAAGIEFYINKPINRVEVISVLRNVSERLHMERSIERLRDSLADFDGIAAGRSGEQPEGGEVLDRENLQRRCREVLSDLGLIGDPGGADLMRIIQFLCLAPDRERYLGEQRRLKDLYRGVQEMCLQEEARVTDARAIEQRVRRAVKHAMEHIAALGLEDYNSPVFERYGPKFFDFSELRQRMKELEREEPASSRTRVNIKQFINALYWEVSG